METASSTICRPDDRMIQGSLAIITNFLGDSLVVVIGQKSRDRNLSKEDLNQEGEEEEDEEVQQEIKVRSIRMMGSEEISNDTPTVHHHDSRKVLEEVPR